VLTRHRKAVAAVISFDDLRALEAAEDDADLAAAREALASPEARVPHSEVLAEFGPMATAASVELGSAVP
jgi:hypothetical protein